MIISLPNRIEYLNWLCNEIKQGKVTFFVGAGISKAGPSALPLGTDLVDGIVNGLCESADLKPKIKNRVLRLSRRLRPEVVFELLYEEVGNSVFNVFQVLRGGKSNRIHRFLTRALSLGNNVFTTNLDVKIEQAIIQSGTVLSVIKSPTAFLKYAHRRRLPTGSLFKLHGSLRIDDRLPDLSTITAALRQVGKGLDNSKAIMLERILVGQHIIVMGYSGRDEFDIIPKITSTPNVKGIIWVVHSESSKIVKDGSPLFYKLQSGPNDHYLKNLLNRIDGPTVCLSCNTEIFVSELWSSVTNERLPRGPILRKVNHIETLRHWAESITQYPLLLIGDICRRANAPNFADVFYKRVANDHGAEADLRSKAFFKSSQAARIIGDLQSAKTNAKSALYWAKRCNNRTLISLAYNILGIAARKCAKWNLAIGYYNAGLKTLQYRGANTEDRANIKNNLGIALDKKGEYKEALKYLRAGLLFARESGDIESVSESLNNVGIVYDNLGNYRNALKHFKESVRLKELIGHMYGLGQTYHNIGLVQEHISDLESAINSYKKSLEIKRSMTRDLHGIAQTEANLSRVFLAKGEIQRAYKYATNSIKILRAQGDILGMAEISETLARILLGLRKHREAKVSIKEAISAFTSLGRTKDVARCGRLKQSIGRMKL